MVWKVKWMFVVILLLLTLLTFDCVFCFSLITRGYGERGVCLHAYSRNIYFSVTYMPIYLLFSAVANEQATQRSICRPSRQVLIFFL